MVTLISMDLLREQIDNNQRDEFENSINTIIYNLIEFINKTHVSVDNLNEIIKMEYITDLIMIMNVMTLNIRNRLSLLHGFNIREEVLIRVSDSYKGIPIIENAWDYLKSMESVRIYEQVPFGKMPPDQLKKLLNIFIMKDLYSNDIDKSEINNLIDIYVKYVNKLQESTTKEIV